MWRLGNETGVSSDCGGGGGRGNIWFTLPFEEEVAWKRIFQSGGLITLLHERQRAEHRCGRYLCAIRETPLTTSLARGHVSDGTTLCHWALQTEVTWADFGWREQRRRFQLMKGPRRDPLPILRHAGVAMNQARARCGALMSDGVGSDPYWSGGNRTRQTTEGSGLTSREGKGHRCVWQTERLWFEVVTR